MYTRTGYKRRRSGRHTEIRRKNKQYTNSKGAKNKKSYSNIKEKKRKIVEVQEMDSGGRRGRRGRRTRKRRGLDHERIGRNKG